MLLVYAAGTTSKTPCAGTVTLPFGTVSGFSVMLSPLISAPQLPAGRV